MARIAAVIEAADAEALEAAAERLPLEDAEILGVYPTFVGGEDGA